MARPAKREFVTEAIRALQTFLFVTGTLSVPVLVRYHCWVAANRIQALLQRDTPRER